MFRYLILNKPGTVVGFIQAMLSLAVAFDLKLSEHRFAAIMSAVSVGIGLLVDGAKKK